jgi:hypothetical protein
MWGNGAGSGSFRSSNFPTIRKIIYPTKAVEWLPMMLFKVTKNRGLFPPHEALKPTGPTSPEGHEICSRNATRHGL